LQENTNLKKQLQLNQEKLDQLQNDNQTIKNERHTVTVQLNDMTSQLMIAKENIAHHYK
jgi:hypothetical protein